MEVRKKNRLSETEENLINDLKNSVETETKNLDSPKNNNNNINENIKSLLKPNNLLNIPDRSKQNLNEDRNTPDQEKMQEMIKKDSYGSYDFDQFEQNILEKMKLSQQTEFKFSANLKSSSTESAVLGFDILNVKERIGNGAFGEVFLATVWGTNVAVKTFPQISEKDKEGFQDEVIVLKNLRHPNCLQFMGYTVEPFSIVTEYMDQGSLFDLLRDKKIRINGAMVIHVSKSVAGGLLYLHSNKILHKDIKSSNVLISENWRKVKLSDFGISLNSKYIGDARYRAPEACLSHYTECCDIYSYGMMLWELLTRRTPYFSHNNKPTPKETLQLIKEGYRPDIPRYSPPWLRKLIQNCWNHDPLLRPPISEILKILGNQTKNSVEDLESQDSQIISEDYLAGLSEKIETALPYGVRRARFYSGIFKNGGIFPKILDWIVSAIFGKVVGIASAGFFLKGESNQWIALFGYDTIDDVRKADQFATRHRDFSQKIEDLCSTPVVREELELDIWNVQKNAKAAIVTHVQMISGHQTECFKIYDSQFVPTMKEKHSKIWRGSIVVTDYYKAKVYLINFFDSRQSAKNFLRTEFISEILGLFKPHISSRPVSELFLISYGYMSKYKPNLSPIPFSFPSFYTFFGNWIQYPIAFIFLLMSCILYYFFNSSMGLY